METLFVATVSLLTLRLGLRPLGDNSTFVHIRTGLRIVGGLGIPRVDPYSFTAAGEPWVVQSWFVSTIYGALHRAAGFDAILLFHGLVYAALGWVVATLARANGVAWRTCIAAVIAVGVGAWQWSPRPLAVGLLCFALTILVVERSLPGWALVPIGWVWVNSHGSFALGGMWLAIVILAGRRDARRYAPWWAAGIAASIVNPLGPRLLTFPLELFERRGNLERVVEWQPPTFRGPLGAIGLVALVAAVALLWRARKRPADLATAVLFIALACIAQRNLAPAAVVLAPVLGRALAPITSTASREPREQAALAINRALAAVIAATAAIFVLASVAGDAVDLDGYPVAAVQRLPDGARVATTDVAGCYLILRDGGRTPVLFDDRYDMYRAALVRDYLVLHDAGERWPDVLDRYDADAVLWPRERKLAALLGEDREWRRVFADDEWVLYVRAA